MNKFNVQGNFPNTGYGEVAFTHVLSIKYIQQIFLNY